MKALGWVSFTGKLNFALLALSVSIFAQPHYSTYQTLSTADNIQNCTATLCWTLVPASLIQVSVGANRGSLYGLDTSGAVWKEDFSTSPPTMKKTGLPAVNYIAVGNSLSIWAIGKNPSGPNAYQLNVGQGSFIQKGNSRLSAISVGGDGDVWATSTTPVGATGYTVLHWDRTLQNWRQMAGSLATVAVGSKSNIWGTDLSHNIWRYNTTTLAWDQIYGTSAQVAAAKDGTVWMLGISLNSSRFNPAANGGNCSASAGAPAASCWTQVAGTVNQIAVGGTKSFWAIGSYNGSYNVYSFHARTVVLTSGIQGYTQCGCQPGMMHTYNVSAQFTGQSAVTRTQQAPPQNNINVFATTYLSGEFLQ